MTGDEPDYHEKPKKDITNSSVPQILQAFRELNIMSEVRTGECSKGHLQGGEGQQHP